MTTAAAPQPLRVGVLALQGSFREHMAMLKQLPDVDVIEVRTKEELESVAGLIIPGGESTTMALIAERCGLIPELQSFARDGKAIWGTCAGMIFLAERAQGAKKGGQALLGGLDMCVSRNFFGAQVDSFEAQLAAPAALQQLGADDKFRAIFIRAPAVVEAGPGVEVLASYKLSEAQQSQQAAAAKAEGNSTQDEVIVAVRSGPLLATAFHPELTKDLRWHQLFVDMVRQQAKQPARTEPPASALEVLSVPYRPADLPVYGQQFMSKE